jgi:hypothetical protein
VGTLSILKVVDVVVGLRVPEHHEIQGLDLSQHGEEGYDWELPAAAAAFSQVAAHGPAFDAQAAMGD